MELEQSQSTQTPSHESVVIFYQSMNSNSSYEHSLTNGSGQIHTRYADSSYGKVLTDGSNVGFLFQPVNYDLDVKETLYGPPQLIQRYESLDKQGLQSSFSKALANSVRTSFQLSPRLFDSSTLSSLVLGEVDGDGDGWTGVLSELPGLKHIGSSSVKKACQCFSAFGVEGQTLPVINDSDVGWISVTTGGINVVYLHVPNEFANNKSKLEAFYLEIFQRHKKLELDIHLVVGDTNQKVMDRTLEAVKAKLSGDWHQPVGQTIEPTDTYGISRQGTNSTGTQIYDIAVYNANLVTIELNYVSQLSTEDCSKTNAFTDHMGMIIKVTKK